MTSAEQGLLGSNVFMADQSWMCYLNAAIVVSAGTIPCPGLQRSLWK